MIKVEQGAHNFVDPCVNETLLALPLAVSNQCSWSWKMGDHSHRQIAEPGRMLVVPSDIESAWEVDGERTMLVLALPNETVKTVLGASCPARLKEAFWPLSEETWSDPLVELMMNRLWESTADGFPASSLLSEGLLISILSQMLIKAGNNLEANTAVVLPQWRLKRVRQFVEANLGSEISLDDLACAAGLSRRHFARSFHQEVGETPHRWLMQMRLGKAKEMLKYSERSLCEISETFGFASQSHFTSALKQATGLTPLKWRQRFRT
ncbi:AraC family transcriptional regulator [Pseudomonas syringae]|nr:AraC family transcriptional regulator [Pseudomonas syringae]